jgi:hypothetical protein
MGYLIDILIGAASRILSGELSAHAEPLARWIINKGAERLPVQARDRFREEWLAHMDETPGELRKFWHAMGCQLAAMKLDYVLRRQRKPATQIGERGLEALRHIRMLCGDAGFEQVIRVALDAAADVKVRPANHDAIVAKVIEEFKWQTTEPWGRRLPRRLSMYWIVLGDRAVPLFSWLRALPPR